MSISSKTPVPEPIAIIGSAGRFPGGANSPSKLWDLISNPRDILSEIPKDRFDSKGFYHPNGERHGATNVTHSYFLSEDVRHFDTSFFAINPREAESMDPQHRILLETVYESLESAGLQMKDMQGSQTGVYVGLMTNDYHDLQLRDMETIPMYTGTGTTRSILSNRISYFFDWKGPSMTIDTACSSSLIAVHQAVQSLRSGECSVALAAGANLILGPEMYIIESKLHMLSPSGRCRMWDEKADGYGRGEGFAAVVLKTLSAAIRDGDSIECVIRETGTNQDGRTPGITMPSSECQAKLTKDTYRRAGLDLRNRADRPQFVEAHGTGTGVGDPVEAEAISKAFFSRETSPKNLTVNDRLFVGSIKTTIGHLEGAAGLAGLLKVALALKNKVVPPNMHFDNLNPKVAPFTNYLRIPTIAEAWPHVPGATVRRVSVASFGFGGSNAHAIMESYESGRESPRSNGIADSRPALSSPLVFSANSDRSLIASVKAHLDHLKAYPATGTMDLAWTLQTKRNTFPFRKAFSGSDTESLMASMTDALRKIEETPTAALGTRASYNPSTQHTPKILGVFTGQGAQWPKMGSELMSSSKVFAKSIDTLEESLQSLPDRPSWSLKGELAAAKDVSKVHEAELSQPLCTAIQVGLVDLLKSAGVRLHATVGHSSGEIGAAYAAGMISATDAIRIAYYRGVHAKVATGKAGQRGTMMAAGLSFDEARELCNRPEYGRRVTVAASNAPSMVTLSGDSDAIDEMKTYLDGDKTFARVLNVDKAYHSHHMTPCSEPYMRSLQACKIHAERPGETHWISSVDPDHSPSSDMISAAYWLENLLNPVLFSQAIESAMRNHGPFDAAVELGPHPALKGPAIQTIKWLANDTIPYHGLLERGRSDIQVFSTALGSLWENFGSSGVQLGQYTESILGRRPVLLKDLPTYQWDHHQTYWKESRLSKNFRLRSASIHELLGTQCADNVEACDLRWRNILKIDEIPWLRGHKFQNQILFPAAGHIALALEASKALSGTREVQIIQLDDIEVGKAITLEEDGPGVEILFTLREMSSLSKTLGTELITAEFACYACHNESIGNMDRCSRGRISLTLGRAIDDLLPPRSTAKSAMVAVDTDEFYDSMDQIGLNYTGGFRTIESITRARCCASASTFRPVLSEDHAEAMMVHPALLDTCFQTVIAAFCFPGDGSFWTPYLPTRIGSIRVNPKLCTGRADGKIDIDAKIVKESSTQIIGDLNAYNSTGQLEIQLEGLVCSSFSKATPATDRLLFSETMWKSDLAIAANQSIEDASHDDLEDLDAVAVNERVSYYYLRTLHAQFTKAQIATFEWWYQRLFEFADHLLPIVASGQHHSLKQEWAKDNYDDILALVRKHPNQIDLQLVVEVGEHLPTFVQGKLPLLEVMMKEDRLTRLYQDGLGVPNVNRDLSATAKQLSHRYPSMKILEIGAGTGGMTREVLKELGGAFGSYTFTDISTGFFEKAKDSLLPEAGGKMVFRALDVEKDPAAQGFQMGSYDVIIASNVLHATRKLSETVANVRGLLRPGGYLLLNEVTGELLRLRFIMSGLPGWWLGGDDGRRFAPTISSMQWDSTLREAGFSGIDIIKQDYSDASKSSLSVIVTQAVDEMVEFLREPLLMPYMAPDVDEVFIIGGKTLQTSRLAKGIANNLRSWNSEITFLNDVNALASTANTSGYTVVCLQDLDTPVLQGLTPATLASLQGLFSQAKNILYLTRGCREGAPYSTAMVGLGRTMLFEYPDLKLQFLDVASFADADPHCIAETLLRLVASESLDPMYLWTVEPEVALEGSRLLIPRLVQNKMLNEKLNSKRRSITHQVSTKECQVVLARDQEHEHSLQSGKSIEALSRCSNDDTIVDTFYSSAQPLGLAEGQDLYLCLGKQHSTEEILIVLSSVSASTVVTPAIWSRKIAEIANLTQQELLRSTAMHLVSQRLLQTLPRGSNIILHEPEEDFATIFSQQAAEQKVSVTFTTTNSQYKTKQGWLWIHPFESRTGIASSLPSGANVLASFSTDESSTRLSHLIGSCMPPSSLFLTNATALQKQLSFAESERECAAHELAVLLDRACSRATRETPNPLIAAMGAHLIGTKSVTELSGVDEAFTVVDWTSTPTITVPVRPTSTKDLFSPNSTYILFGLSGEIGVSLATYLIENGARYVVLTSRNPQTSDAWVEEQRLRGATVKFFSNDITIKADVESLLVKVCETMPAIGGVVNGAMVLRDKLFANMNLDDWLAATKPKIDGSRHLDELFGSDKSLEFFVMFSSLASVIGNSGQASYNAGNTYCSGLAEQRRKRGLVASVLDIGKIVGIGYVARNRKAVISLRSHKFQPISEPLFHQMFAEAVISGRPDSGRQPVLSAGLQKRLGLAEEDSIPPLWMANPRFSHMMWEKDEFAGAEDASAPSRVPVKEKLEAAKNFPEANDALVQALITKLGAILQLAPESINKNTALSDIGIDSLVAVEIRSWFLKELNVDVPVLKILGGNSIAELCTEALSRVPWKWSWQGTGTEPEQKPVIELAGAKDVPASTLAAAQEPMRPARARDTDGDADSFVLVSSGNHTRSTSRSPSPPTSTDNRQIQSSDTTTSSPRMKPQPDQVKLASRTTVRTGPLSHAQERLWLANNCVEDPTTYNVAFGWKLKGALQVLKLETAFQAVVQQHESLRTAFFVDDSTGKPSQTIYNTTRIPVTIKDVHSEDEVHAEFVKLRRHVFDLQEGQVMKVVIIQISERVNILMVCYHHIIMDGVALHSFLLDLNRAYGSPAALLRPTSQYLDFAKEHNEIIANGNMKDDLRYWKEIFRDNPAPLPLLPFARVRSRLPTARCETVIGHAFVSKDTVSRIKEVSRQVQSTSVHFYSAALEVLLFQIQEGTTEDICLGIADANRLDNKYMDTIGFFLNLLPVRTQVNGQERFDDLIKRTRKNIYGALAHSKVPFDILLEELKVPRSSSHSPLFQVLLNYTLGIQKQSKLFGCQMEMVEVEDASTSQDLVVSIIETPDEDTALSFTMQKSLYLEEDCRRLANLYVEVLDTLSKDPGTLVNQCSLHRSSSVPEAITVGIGPRMEFLDWPETVSHRFDDMVQKFPEHMAVKLGFGEQHMTYLQLNDRSKRIAQIVFEAGASSKSGVAVLCQPCLDGVASILAIFRIGANYIPLDPRNPRGRLSAMVGDSSPAILLCDDEMSDTASALGVEHECAVINMSSVSNVGSKFERNLAKADEPAITLYTSGSTGKPKGIALAHKNWVNQFAGVTKEYNIGQETMLQQSSCGFDMAIDQTFVSLCNGGTLVVAPKEIRGDAIEISNLMLEMNITYTMAVPSEYSAMIRHGGDSLRQCRLWKFGFSGGEKISDHLREGFRALVLPELMLINVYGPTEITVSCCRGIVPVHENMELNHDFCPVGSVLPNYAVYILDGDGRLVPQGFPGEIYIGGLGIGNGYLMREKLSAQKFIPDTFATEDKKRGWSLMYKTGDRGRLLNNGSLVFIERMDDDSQIKLRGQRIELDEIANTILRAANGRLANVVISPRGQPDTFLVAFAVFSSDSSGVGVDHVTYLKQLRRELPLPQYMRPAAIVPLLDFPLGVNGKINRRAIDAITLPSNFDDDLATELEDDEKELLRVWEEVLPSTVRQSLKIDRDTDFFEAGGNSLLLIKLQAAIQQEMGVKMSLVEMVEHCSLGAMAQRLSKGSATTLTIDWEKETAIPELEYSTAVDSSSEDQPVQGRTVILTGGTGFLGGHILQHLVASERVAQVHCIAIRQHGTTPRDLPIQSKKIVVHYGDLSLPRLGLSEAAFTSLSALADAIIHNGADVSFLKSYTSIRKSNVVSTRELIRLAGPHRIPIHFVSSAGVAAFVPPSLLPLREVSLRSYPPDVQGGSHGYQAAKWASERMLEKAAELLNIKVCIHRPTGIVGAGAPESDIVANLLRYSRELRAAPTMEGWSGYFDFVPVESVADDVCSRVLSSQKESTSDVGAPLITIVHNCNEEAFPVAQLGSHLEKECGGDGRGFECLGMGEWIEKARKLGLGQMVGMYLAEVTEKGQGNYPKVVHMRSERIICFTQMLSAKN